MSINVRTLYDTATTGLTQDAAAVLADDNIQVEFLRGTSSSNNNLEFKNTSASFIPEYWWGNNLNKNANGFVGIQAAITAAGGSSNGDYFPYIGSLIANDGTTGIYIDAHITIDENWLQFCPGGNSNTNKEHQLFIKTSAKSGTKITGYTIYFYDLLASSNGIGITSGDINTTTTTTTTHHARQVISEIQGNWNTSGNDIDGYSGVRTYSKAGIEITGNNYIYIYIDDNNDVLDDPALIKLEFTVEPDVLAPPTVTFPSGTVTFGDDSKIDKTPDGIAWQYSTNGTTYNDIDTGDSYQLPVGTYNAETFYVRNRDGQKFSEAEKNQNQIIVRPPPPTVNFPVSSVLIQSATVTITSLGTGASGWQYSIDTGVNFSDGTGTTFSLPAGTYAQNHIQVRNGSGTNWSTTENNLSQIVVSFSPPVVVFPGSGENGIVNITLGNSATAWQYSIDTGVSFSNGSGTKFTLQPETYAQNQIQVHNGDGTNWSTTENNDSEIEISAPPTPPSEPVSTTETVDIRKSYYPESKVNSTSNSLFNKVYSQKLLTSVDKIERTPLELKKDKSVEQYHNGTQDRLLRIKSKAMNNK